METFDIAKYFFKNNKIFLISFWNLLKNYYNLLDLMSIEF